MESVYKVFIGVWSILRFDKYKVLIDSYVYNGIKI